MPVPTRISDLSATLASNSPQGTDNIGTDLDNFFRAAFGIIRGDLASKGADIASATTTDIGAVQGLYHDITGSTTVTGLGTVGAGIHKVLQFDSALTLTHHATQLVLPGGSNITTATGDIGWFVSDGSGNWRCIVYTRADGTSIYPADGPDNKQNYQLACSVGSNALTIALKTKAGADPTSTTPAKINFRNATAATGDYATVSVTGANSLVISSGSTLGTTNSTAFRFWIVAFNDAGTFRLGAVNCLSGTSILQLKDDDLRSSTAEGGAGAADSAQVIYTGTAVSSKAMRVLGYLEYSSGLGTAGTYGSTPTKVQLFGAGLPLPGTVVQTHRTDSGAVATGTTVIPLDDSIPQSTEGDQYLSQAITPSSATNVLRITSLLNLANTAAGHLTAALFQDATANALKAASHKVDGTNDLAQISTQHVMLAATTSATTFKARGGNSAAGTTTFNGSAGGRIYGGVINSFLEVAEVAA